MFGRYSFRQLLASESCAFLGEPGMSLGRAGTGQVGHSGKLSRTALPRTHVPRRGRQIGGTSAGVGRWRGWGVRVRLYTGVGWGHRCGCVCCFISKKEKKRKKMDEMIFLFPLFFLSYKAHEKCSFFFFLSNSKCKDSTKTRFYSILQKYTAVSHSGVVGWTGA